MSFDLVIRGGTVATGADVFKADIGIRNERVVAIADRIVDGRRVIDATGKIVLPGGIDAHCHLDQSQAPGLASKGARMADGFRSGSISAAFGGTTTIVPFCVQHRGQSLTAAVADYHERAAGQTVGDYAFHLIISDPTPAVLGQELPALIRRGHTSLKVYMTYEAMQLSDRQILDVFEIARQEKAIMLIHAENHEIIGWLADRLERSGRTTPVAHAQSRPLPVEREATHRAVTLAEIAGVPLVVVHVSGGDPLEEIRRARTRGHTVLAETCPQYLLLTAQDLDQPDMLGAKVMCSPPPRDTAAQAALWRGIEDGTVDIVNSDHAPYRFDAEGKLKAGPNPSFRGIANGIPGLETRLPILFSEGVVKGRIDLPRFVALTATNNAKLYGLYPRKGTIAIGSDADIVVWDPERRTTITNDLLHHNVDYTPFEGLAIEGWPETVISRGEVIVQGGTLTGTPGRGRFLTQQTSSAWNTREIRAWI
ncbi:dihydropyrimidinase [Chelatococcus asaccharovorans]|uniref:Dihydropyrimidinase n=1 Tax=Chelatococcus asaccharovorans TaxID=28210 RepID=A0A2V3TY07_9HYPH|nr:dihydropyrimidinase [Chelatococcus asaccharovorans]MBS7705060.1 dihydropyrimidinase [Chelatococcus asaccharovorans]PXW53550.1 dihydropyrimidinase [Chelatococcus asaccharovorans]